MCNKLRSFRNDVLGRLRLTQTTLCAVAGRLVPQTIMAIEQAMAVADFAEHLFVSDRQPERPLPDGVRLIIVPDLSSRERYSHVMQRELVEHVATEFVMIVQWDGYPRRAKNWTDELLAYDYVGAPWPQFRAPYSVGNGGFSLRSRRLLRACLDPRYKAGHPEDISICHNNRELLEHGHGIRFAPPELAARFSYERSGDPMGAFGFHGVFNMPQEMGVSDFLALFSSLDRSMIGARELRDLWEVLKSSEVAGSAGAASSIMQDLFRREWYRPNFWRRTLKAAVSTFNRGGL